MIEKWRYHAMGSVDRIWEEKQNEKQNIFEPPYEKEDCCGHAATNKSIAPAGNTAPGMCRVDDLKWPLHAKRVLSASGVSDEVGDLGQKFGYGWLTLFGYPPLIRRIVRGTPWSSRTGITCRHLSACSVLKSMIRLYLQGV